MTAALEAFGPQAALVLLPLLGAASVAWVRDPRIGGWVVVGVAAATFALSCWMPARVAPGAPLIADRLEAHMALLTALTGLAAAWCHRTLALREAASGRLPAGAARRGHARLLALLGLWLLAASSDDIGLGWVAIEAGVITTALAIGRRTPAAAGAARSLLLVGGAGLAVTLLGIVFLALAAGPDAAWLSWGGLMRTATTPGSGLRPPLLDLAFVFLLIGYGMKAGLAPLAWLPDARAEGPTPVAAMLAGAGLAVALTVLLRLRRLLDATAGAVAPGPAILALGLASVLLAGFGLWRRDDVRRFVGLSAVGQGGLAAVAIGIGGPLATYAALLQITLHTLASAALGQCVGHAVQVRGGQRCADLGGLAASRPLLAFTLAAAMLAWLGVPPSGLFVTRFAILGSAVRDAPLLAAPLALGLLVGGWAMLSRLVALCLGAPAVERGPPAGWRDLLSAWALLAAVVLGGLAPPAAATDWLRAIAESLP